MLIDARKLQENQVVEAEVCIVGAGPAGIALAREFAGKSFRVYLLESGGLDFDQQIQSLCTGETTGEPYHDLSEVRRRQFGGTANVWDTRLTDDQRGFRGAPLDEIDFEYRDWLPYSGWPFDRSELAPFYRRAQKVAGFGPYLYDGEEWENQQAPMLRFDGKTIATTIWQFGSQHTFTQVYQEEIERSDNVFTLLNGNAIEIETDEAGASVTRVRVACLDGNRFWVGARIFILAAGGIENPRLLLLSDRVHKKGIGNQNDLVGRFFMEHPFVNCGSFIPSSRKIFNDMALYDTRQVNGATIMGMLKLTDEAMRREKLLNFNLVLLPQHDRFRPEAINSLKALISRLARGRLPDRAGHHLNNVVRGLDYISVVACRKLTGQSGLFPYVVDGPGLCSPSSWSSLSDKERRYSFFKAFMTTEQAPDPDNRVMLGDERDQLGCRKVQLSWRWGEVNIESIRRAQQIIERQVTLGRLGRLQIEVDGNIPKLASPGLHHHMGTTRMHNAAAQGVVNENCQVHGVSNLFITGSSVFPTGGCINPTLTIIALAIRLAEHVKKALRNSVLLGRQFSPGADDDYRGQGTAIPG